MWLASADVVRLERGDRRAHIGGARFSTVEMLELERDLVDTSGDRRGADVALASAPAVHEVRSQRVSDAKPPSCSDEDLRPSRAGVLGWRTGSVSPAQHRPVALATHALGMTCSSIRLATRSTIPAARSIVSIEARCAHDAR
jgi:hypothetical protein